MSDLQRTSSTSSSCSSDYFGWNSAIEFRPLDFIGEDDDLLGEEIFKMDLTTTTEPPPPPPPIQQPQPILSLSTASLEELYTPEATQKTGGKKPRKCLPKKKRAHKSAYDIVHRRASLNKSKYNDPHEDTECEDCGRDLGSPKKLKLCEKVYNRSDFQTTDDDHHQYEFADKNNRRLTVGCKAMLCAACWAFHELIHVGITIHRHRKRDGHGVKQRFVHCMPLNQRSPILFRELVLNRYALKEARAKLELPTDDDNNK